MLLIHPPVFKPCEPPAGIARLAGVLSKHSIPHRIIDANLEGLLYLLGHTDLTPSDKWTTTALRNRDRHLTSLKDASTYHNIDHYRRIVRDINRVLDKTGVKYNTRLGLADFQHPGLSPVRSGDLLQAAAQPDQNPFYQYFTTRLSRQIEEKSPDVIGISLNFLSQALTTFALIGFLQQTRPGNRIIMGGSLITSWMRNPAWCDSFRGLVDDCVAGPGEDYLLALHNLEVKDKGPTTPDYEPFAMMDYLAPSPVIPYAASSGCWWRKCEFCPETTEKNPYRPVPVSQVMNDLDLFEERYPGCLIHFLDNALSPQLLKQLVRRKIPAHWYGYARFTPDLEDPDFCHALKHSGCRLLKLGLESGDQAVLDQMQKGIRLSRVSRILGNLKSAGIPTYIYILFGTPREDEAAARHTMDFIVRNHEAVTFLNPAVFYLPVFSGETETLEIRSFSDGDLSLYTDFTHPRGWHRAAVRRFLDREFKRHPVIAAILKRTPLVFTSNHAPFCVMR